MSTFRTPVGPQSPQVYWRRRLMVILGVLAVIVVVVLIIVRPGAGAPAKENPKTPPGTSAPTDEPAAQKEGEDCNPANLTLEAVTDKTTYLAGEKPLISMKITNGGSVACLVNAGTTQQLFQITSGTETYWKSTDCQTDAVEAPTVLEPGVAKSTTPLAWDRTRSDSATCKGDRPAVTAGGASYHLKVSMGDLAAENTAQFLLY